MPDFPEAGPSQPRSHSVGFLTQKGPENLPFPPRFSRQKLQYTSSKKAPMTPAPSRSSSTEADHHSVKPPFTQELAESPAGSTIQPEQHLNRLAAVYHKYNPQKVFENRGSTARDHLASERTFLAYVRTSLALASTGVALVQLFTIADLTSSASNTPPSAANKRLQKFARPLGVTTVVMALIMLNIGIYFLFLSDSEF